MSLSFSFFLYILPDPLSSIIGRCTLYTPILRPNILVTFCSNRNTLTFDSNSYKKTNLSGVKIVVIVSPLPLVDAHTKICPKY